MLEINLQTPIKEISKIGQGLHKRLEYLGLKTIQDLFYYFPLRYEAYTETAQIDQITTPGQYTVKGTLTVLQNRRAFSRKMTITEAVLADDSGSIKIIWFNQPFLSKVLEIGQPLQIAGKVDDKRGGLSFISPQYETNYGVETNTGQVVPVYSVTEKLTQKQVRGIIKPSLKYLYLIKDFLPAELKQKHDLIDLYQALAEIHYPISKNSLAKAKTRLKYDELFRLIYKMTFLRQQIQSNQSIPIKFRPRKTKEFVNSLPFTLTDDQKKVSWQILKDIEQPKPMNRLVQGDVGSGKTVVAAMAILNVALSNKQSVLMAPTEVLAKQHFKSLINFFKESSLPIILITASTKQYFDGRNLINLKPKQAEKFLNTQKNLIIVGTHALIQAKIDFLPIGLVIVDEQHRFGVAQRGKLRQKVLAKYNLQPHYLCLTATPIPRSLTLTIYGDLNVSVIRQMPKNRKPIKTKLVLSNQRQDCYQFIKQELLAGNQAFIVCPLIDQSDALQAKSVNQEFEFLRDKVFKDFKVGLLHGKMKSKEKDEIMLKFRQKAFDILVSTTVIEVGVDVAQATIMVIEGAERFGLSQLHQLRGRVGRGQDQAYCFLFCSSDSGLEKQRLRFLEKINDGFILAEKDLQIRGPGELYGVRQSGDINLKLASLMDYELIEQVKLDIEQYFDQVDSEKLLGDQVWLD